MKIALLTGGGDKPYAIGLLGALVAAGVTVDLIGSDDFLDAQAIRHPDVNFLNLRKGQDPGVSLARKLSRVFLYYCRLFLYASSSDCEIFHILWANRFPLLDRVALIQILKWRGKRLVFTAHNVNERERDGGDTFLNRRTLASLYDSVDHIFVHTRLMKQQLGTQFQVDPAKVTVIPFGVNNTLPRTALTRTEARARLDLGEGEKVVLFFGNIASYKGLEFAVRAVDLLRKRDRSYRLLIAGQIKGEKPYWDHVQGLIGSLGVREHVTSHIRYIDDRDVEAYFVAADVLVLPYKFIYQSGVLFLSYSFGLPVIAADVGSLAEDIVVGKTGLLCRSEDPEELAAAIDTYFASELFGELEANRYSIVEFANDHYSWDTVGTITQSVYAALLGGRH